MATMQPVNRIQHNLLAIGERRLLTWLAARMPASVTPDRLTSVGFVGALLVAAGYALSGLNAQWLLLSVAAYFINWFGDSLDGSLARYRKIERPKFGYFIDHSMDSLGNLIIMIALGSSPYLRMDIALFGLSGYLLLSIHTFIAARVVDEFRLSYVAAGPTELRIVLIIMTLLMLNFGPVTFGETGLSGVDMFIGGLGAVLIALFIFQTARTASQLRRLGK